MLYKVTNINRWIVHNQDLALGTYWECKDYNSGHKYGVRIRLHQVHLRGIYTNF